MNIIDNFYNVKPMDTWDVYAGFTFMGTIKARNAFNAINKFKHLSPDTTNWSAKRR